MTQPNSENTPETPAAAAPAPAPQPDSRRRLRELLSIPERDRTDEQWDEIIELEIQLAPGNRLSPGEQVGSAPVRGTQGKSAGGGAGQQKKQHRPRTSNNRRPRQGKAPAGGGSTGNPA